MGVEEIRSLSAASFARWIWCRDRVGAGDAMDILINLTPHQQSGPLVIQNSLFQLAAILQTYPYYLTYYNPFMVEVKSATSDDDRLGEGLDQAARYLNANRARAGCESWPGIQDGSFSYFFDGETLGSAF